MGPECKDPLDPDVDLCIVQLSIEGTVGAIGPWIQPHCHLPPPKWLNTAADKGQWEVCACPTGSLQLLDNVV
jgi:hypothetical protein